MTGTKTGAIKRRQTMIDTRFNGDEAAYNEWQRTQAGKGGTNTNANGKHPTNFKNNPKLAKSAGKKSGIARRANSIYANEPDHINTNVGVEQ